MHPLCTKPEILTLDPGGDGAQIVLGTASSDWRSGLAGHVRSKAHLEKRLLRPLLSRARQCPGLTGLKSHPGLRSWGEGQLRSWACASQCDGRDEEAAKGHTRGAGWRQHPAPELESLGQGPQV